MGYAEAMRQVTVGVLFDADFEYGVGVLEGVRDEARGRPEWRVLPVPYAQEGFLTRLARTGALQAVIGAFISDRWLRDRLPPSLAAVNVANLSHIGSVSSVVPDDRAAGRLVARHFCDLGYRNVGVVSERATYAAELRREGFLGFMAGHEGVRVTEPAGEAGYRHESAWQAWLDGLAPDTAVFCTGDHLACRLWQTAKALAAGGPPPFAALAGVGDSLTDRVASGLDLTSVALPARRVGQRAAARVAALLAGEGTEAAREEVAPAELTVRGSTARFASGDETVARALGVALRTLAQNPGVEAVARQTGVSRRTLEMRFRAAFGQGPAEVFRARRIEEARRLLAETDLTTAEVAARVGCASVQAFTTLFREACGMPPAGYRRSLSRSRK